MKVTKTESLPKKGLKKKKKKKKKKYISHQIISLATIKEKSHFNDRSLMASRKAAGNKLV